MSAPPSYSWPAHVDPGAGHTVFRAAAPGLVAVCGSRYLMQDTHGTWRWAEDVYQEAAEYLDDQGWLQADRQLIVTPLWDTEPVTVTELGLTAAGLQAWYALPGSSGDVW